MSQHPTDYFFPHEAGPSAATWRFQEKSLVSLSAHFLAPCTWSANHETTDSDQKGTQYHVFLHNSLRIHCLMGDMTMKYRSILANILTPCEWAALWDEQMLIVSDLLSPRISKKKLRLGNACW
ncbi:hypothetical protein AVEN_205803-1 [Araneus ventricosus]|uniref:Uncharacterized protein n=1 Tax=Araneus ventricosus TaxID=182803 RepID=A0A4Y2JX57_ARAVE|nr:hypothetical protein AVEN_205803-1 [Araneus ventricosus]